MLVNRRAEELAQPGRCGVLKLFRYRLQVGAHLAGVINRRKRSAVDDDFPYLGQYYLPAHLTIIYVNFL